MKITVVGSGGWGTALAIHLCKNGHEVTLWSHNPEKAASMTSTRVNPMLPGAILPPELVCSGDPASVRGRDMVVLAVLSVPGGVPDHCTPSGPAEPSGIGDQGH